jgi:hypothetical protein
MSDTNQVARYAVRQSKKRDGIGQPQITRAARPPFVSEVDTVVTLGRPGRKLKLSGRQWEKMIEVVTSNGWQPSIPAEMLFVNDTAIDPGGCGHTWQGSPDRARRVRSAQAGKTSRFDLGKFSELVSIASEGNFFVWVAIKSLCGPVEAG